MYTKWHETFNQTVNLGDVRQLNRIFYPFQFPKAVNGLLSPLCEEAVRASQASLCEMLQKERSLGTGSTGGGGAGTGGGGTMDHSALIPLRSKGFREKSDVHFLEVIKEDRWEKK